MFRRSAESRSEGFWGESDADCRAVPLRAWAVRFFEVYDADPDRERVQKFLMRLERLDADCTSILFQFYQRPKGVLGWLVQRQLLWRVAWVFPVPGSPNASRLSCGMGVCGYAG